MSTQTAVEPYTQDPQDHGFGPAQDSSTACTAAGSGVQRLKSERVQEELRAMPGWELAHEEKTIERVKVYPTPEVAALYAAFVTRFASAAGFFVNVGLSGGQACVTVYAPQINGCPGEVTESVLAFARQL